MSTNDRDSSESDPEPPTALTSEKQNKHRNASRQEAAQENTDKNQTDATINDQHSPDPSEEEGAALDKPDLPDSLTQEQLTQIPPEEGTSKTFPSPSVIADHPNTLNTERAETEPPSPLEDHDTNLLDINYLNDPESLLVKAYKLTVRSGPGHNFPAHRTLRKGDKVRILKRKGNWVKIGKGEWVSAYYLQPLKKQPGYPQ